MPNGYLMVRLFNTLICEMTNIINFDIKLALHSFGNLTPFNNPFDHKLFGIGGVSYLFCYIVIFCGD